MNIKDICIVGGGTSGFMTAALLAKYNKNSNSNLNIKCVYSSDIGSIGVGESTLLSIKDLIRYLELEDKEWMPKCNATYKISIGFESWYKDNKRFYYPFGNVTENSLKYHDLFFHLSELFPEKISSETFSRMMLPHTALSESNKLTNLGDTFENVSQYFAYHFDSQLFGKYLYEYSKNLGVEFIDDLYLDSNLDSNGNIQSIICKNSGNHNADLFVDCTGFKSLLLGEKLKTKYISYENVLINNRAYRTKIPYTNKEKQLKNYTNCLALDNGWCWEIPLWDCISLGYVHTTKFESEENILNEFKEVVKKRHGYELEDNEIKVIDFKSGRYEKGFVNNVVAVGLSYGFLEPLESTGIYSTLNNSFRLLEILSKRENSIRNVEKEMFNFSTSSTMDRLSSFVQIHYAFSSRNKTDYWKYVVDECKYDWSKFDFKDSLEMSIAKRSYLTSADGGLPYILVGLGYSPISRDYLKSEIKRNTQILECYQKIFDEWDEYDSQIKSRVDNYLSTYQFLKNTIY